MHESIHSNVYAPLQGMKYFLVSATRPQQPGCAAVRCGGDAADITLKSPGSLCLTSACVRAASLASTSKMAQDKLLPHSQDGQKEESTSFGSNGFVYITHSVTLWRVYSSWIGFMFYLFLSHRFVFVIQKLCQ